MPPTATRAVVAVPNRDLQQLLRTNFFTELTTRKQSTDEPCEVLRLSCKTISHFYVDSVACLGGGSEFSTPKRTVRYRISIFANRQFVAITPTSVLLARGALIEFDSDSDPESDSLLSVTTTRSRGSSPEAFAGSR